MRAPLSSAMTTDLCADAELGCGGALPAAQRRVNSRWDWGGGRGPPESVGELRGARERRQVRVLVTHGASDLVTPYFGTR